MILSLGTNADISRSDLRSIQHLFRESYMKQEAAVQGASLTSLAGVP
jgi:hypothetical protein